MFVVLLQQPQGAQRFEAGCGTSGVCEFSRGEGMFVDCDRSLGLVRRVGGGFGMVMRLYIMLGQFMKRHFDAKGRRLP